MLLNHRHFVWSLSFSFLALISSTYGETWKAGKYITVKSKDPFSPKQGLEITLGPEGKPAVEGLIGQSLPNIVGVSDTECADGSSTDDVCVNFGDYAQLKVIMQPESSTKCGRVEWTSAYARSLKDCFKVKPDTHWYGGGETYVQRWPVSLQERSFVPFITGDHLNNSTFFAGGVLEKYWLASNGVGIFFDEEVPLYYSITTGENAEICFTAQDDHPFPVQKPLKLSYSVCIGDNVLGAHQLIQQNFFERPTSIPEERMLVYPFWSTWAQYFSSVDQVKVLEYTRRVASEGFEQSSHIEIDDSWETCYGEETFNLDKFPTPKAMIDEIKSLGFNVTVWTHPFVNTDCPLFKEGLEKGYFVKEGRGKAGISSWWQGSNSGAIDVTNPEAVKWWHARLNKLRQETGVDSFKFDAGESNWLTYHPLSFSPEDAAKMPNFYTTKFVDACSEFGGMIEVRSAHRNQKHGIFVRMMDKDSSWSYGNGIKSLIPTLFHFGLLGYPFVLPDMIGGNAYGGRPSKELYVRWMQANVLMPSVQFSIVPWDFDAETVQLVKDVLAIRYAFKDELLKVANDILTEMPVPSPINRPLWWLDPEDAQTYTIDTEYTLGNNIIVAPILDEGATFRDIYLPQGTWTEYGGSETFAGPTWLRNVQVPLNKVPVYVRQ